MKKGLLLFFLTGACSISFAQEYEMSFKARLMFSGNDVKCDSYFVITFTTENNNSWTWFEPVAAAEDQWKEYNKTFRCSANDRVVNIGVYSMRRYERGIQNACTQGGSGSYDSELTEIQYVCGGGSIGSSTGEAFPGYDGQSSLSYQIKPISGTHAIFVDSKFQPGDNLMRAYYKVAFEYTDGTSEDVSEYRGRDLAAGQEVHFREAIIKSGKNQTVARVEVFVERIINVFDVRSYTRSYAVSDPGELSTVLNDAFQDISGGASTLEVKYKLFQTNVSATLTGDVLPSENGVTVYVEEPFHESFRWQYIIGSETTTEADIQNATWTYLPSSFGFAKRITLTGSSFFTALGLDHRNYYFRRVFFRAVYFSCVLDVRTTAIANLRHVPSAPAILELTAKEETCNGSADGQLVMKFSRALEPGETVTIELDGSIRPELANIDAFDVTHRFTIFGLSPGTHNIELIGKYNGEVTYTDGADHIASGTIPVTPPIANFTAVKTDIHCFGGEDGTITVSAQGGTPDFTASLFQDNSLITSVSFVDGGRNVFNNLKSGTYAVELRDSNGCEPPDGTGNVVLTLAQPLQNVFLSSVDNVEPLGFGGTDGHVTVRSQEGTAPYSFEWTDANGNTLTPEPSQTEGSSMTSRLSNIGKGVYRVRSQDANYGLAFPQTEVNVRGCYDTISILVDEPPLLEVALAEHHYISCYGYDDGEIVAHAKGGRPYTSGETYHPYQYQWIKLENGSPVAFGQSDSIATDRVSAIYRIQVTDRNGITAWSPDFLLAQPAPLVLNFNTSQLLCNGDDNGTSEVIPQGGTTPYRYAWSTDQTSSRVENLTDGFYSVVVTDLRGCTKFGQTEVQVPNSLTVSAELVNPTCFQNEDGSIRLVTSGGKEPYQYAWTHGPQTEFIANLREGEYQVTVADANDCFLVRNYSLSQPGLLAVDLGPDKVLCKDQSLEIDASIDDPFAQYQWSRNGSVFANTASARLLEAATYRVQVTNSKGCVNFDEIKITRDETVIAANFVVATRVPKGERVRIANISYPAPDYIEWIVPDGTTVIEETTDYIELIFNEFTEYLIGLTAMKGDCEQTEFQTVTAVDKSELTDYEVPDEPYIKQFMVTPNSNDGKFTVTVELKERADFELIMYGGQGNVIMQREFLDQTFTATDVDVSSSVSSGIYMLQLITGRGIATFKIMIK